MTKIGPPSGVILRCLCVCSASLCLLIGDTQAIIIQIDYDYDTNDFFSAGSAQRERLEEAAAFFENLLTDDLSAITPDGVYASFIAETWQATFTHPSTGNPTSIDDLAVPADTIMLYPGARSFSGGQIAEGGFGGMNPLTITDSEFDIALKTRGESGITAGTSGDTDFAPWGGYLSVDTGTSWDTSVAGNGTTLHLYSTLLHEIAHVVGLGTSESWRTSTNLSNEFVGSASAADYGGNVPLAFSSGTGLYDHWGEGITSNIRGTTISQEVALDPTADPGVVKLLTDLDVAGLDDLGWDIAVIPEPGGISLIGLASLVLLRRRR